MLIDNPDGQRGEIGQLEDFIIYIKLLIIEINCFEFHLNHQDEEEKNQESEIDHRVGRRSAAAFESASDFSNSNRIESLREDNESALISQGSDSNASYSSLFMDDNLEDFYKNPKRFIKHGKTQILHAKKKAKMIRRNGMPSGLRYGLAEFRADFLLQFIYYLQGLYELLVFESKLEMALGFFMKSIRL